MTGSITSVSWIPSEAVTGLARLPFGTGIAHYDAPPPESIGVGGRDIAALGAMDRFRFANVLSAWIDVEKGRIVKAGYCGGGTLGSTTLDLGRAVSIAAVALPDKQAEPEHGAGRVRFLQTSGGRTGVPAPRTVRHPPFVQYHAPIAWSTLSLTLHTDGRVEGELVGASPFPRHWIYDEHGALCAKTGVIDFRSWYKHAFGAFTPWGDLDSPALVTSVETALERELSSMLMRSGRKPDVTKHAAGTTIVRQGEPGDRLLVLLDGVLGVEVDGKELAQIGPGAVLGERAVIEHGFRTSTLRAHTKCTVASISPGDLEDSVLHTLAADRRREDAQQVDCT